jgi:hypothetical protein
MDIFFRLHDGRWVFEARTLYFPFVVVLAGRTNSIPGNDGSNASRTFMKWRTFVPEFPLFCDQTIIPPKFLLLVTEIETEMKLLANRMG